MKIVESSNYKVMSRAFRRQAWHVEHFNTEAEARRHANECYKHGDADIELYAKTREGYRPIKAIHVGRKQAIENFAIACAEDAPCFI